MHRCNLPARLRRVSNGSHISAMQRLEAHDQPLYGRRTGRLRFPPFTAEQVRAFDLDDGARGGPAIPPCFSASGAWGPSVAREIAAGSVLGFTAEDVVEWYGGGVRESLSRLASCTPSHTAHAALPSAAVKAVARRASE